MNRRLLVLTIFVVLSCARKVAAPPVRPAAGGEKGTVWLATYLLGKRVGYSTMRCVPLRSGFRFDNFTYMTVAMMGKVQRVQARSRVITNPDLTLRAFDFQLASQDGAFSARGQVSARTLTFTGGREKGARRLWLTRAVYPIEALGKLVVESKPDSGAVLNYLTFDGTVLDTLPTTVAVFGWEGVKAAGGEVRALKTRITRAKFQTLTWFDENGMTVQEESDIGMNSYRVSEKEVFEGGAAGFPVDVLRVFAIPADTSIPSPAKTTRLLLEVSGVDTAAFNFAPGYQRFVSVSPLRVEVVIPRIERNIRLPVSGPDEYLKPSVAIESDAPAIRQKAQELVSGVADAPTAAQRILEWVHTAVKKEAVASLPSALDVLKSLKGDCNEHSVLYAALARAAGIPAKVVVGLVYLDGAFYYHAWNEVYLGDWVPVDPTFGEFPADAARLKLAEGDLSRQAEVLGVVKRLGLRILEFH